MLIPYEWREETKKQVKSIISLPRQCYKYSLFFLEICCRTSTSAVSVHRKAASAAAGLRLPVTLAVACYIIYAVLDLMEHMCVCGWHSSQIKWNGARAHQTQPMVGMRGPDRLMEETLSLICMRTHTAMHVLNIRLYLHIMETSRCTYSMHSTTRSHQHQTINKTEHGSPSGSSSPTSVLNFCSLLT